MAVDEAPVEVEAAVASDQSRRRGRLDPALVVIAVAVIVAVLVLADLNHDLERVFPDGAGGVLRIQSPDA